MENDQDIQVKEALPEYKKLYTYADYITWGDDERYEIIDGIPYKMSAPTTHHQSISVKLTVELYGFLKNKSCKVFHAPYDVRLNADTYDNIIVQPDIVIICDHTKITEACCVGAPDMVIEILSPSTESHDKKLKINKYLQAGIREYWIIDPVGKSLTVYLLEEMYEVTHVYTAAEKVSVQILPGCSIDLQEVFEE